MNSNSLYNEGFQQWIPFQSEVLHRIPESPGVYVLRLSNGVSFGRLKGNSDILYIGRSTSSLRKRLNFYFNPGPTQLTSIRVNKMLNKYGTDISWCSVDDPKDTESKLIQAYLSEHDELPPFNAQSGSTEDRLSNDHEPQVKAQSNRDRIMESIKDSERGICDDCLSSQSGVKPRQQVYQIASSLAKSDLIDRVVDTCPHCGKQKTINRKKA